MIVTVNEMKAYLRIDFEDDDSLLANLIEQAQKLCMDVARIDDEDEFEEYECARFPVMYATAYLYEHREEADHRKLVLDLRQLLISIRTAGF